MTTPFNIARQTFDGLGRQRSVEVAGRTTGYHYRAGQLQPTANTLPDGKQVAYTYEPQLGNALVSTKAEGCSAQRLTYHPVLGIPTQATGDLGTQQWQFTPAGQAQVDTWTVDGVAHATTWRHSFKGLLLGFDDAAGVTHQRQHDAFGRVAELRVGDVVTRFTYDAFSRLDTVTCEDPFKGRQLRKQLGYDSMGREQRSTFTISEPDSNRTFIQTLAWSALDQLVSRCWDDGEQPALETFVYDLRGRLVLYTADAQAAPPDPFGNPIVEQRFTFNPLDGYQCIVTTFADGSKDTATYSHAEHDPTQVVAVTHTHPSWPARIELTYDACGRLIADSLGRTLTWDAHDRLVRVELNGRGCDYRYDASGQLRDRELDGLLNRSFFSAAQLTHEQQGDERLSLIGDGTSLFATSKLAGAIRQTTLLGCDSQGSVRLEYNDKVRRRRYSAHGAEHQDEEQSPLGYAGERRDPLTGWLVPGGYRPYDPLLMIFLAPDSESPFGRGGINPYTYCGGDPVNRVDPDGHSWVTWAAAGIGLALGAAATIASLGAAAPAVAALFAGSLSASGALAIGTAALNLVSLGTGAAAMALQNHGKHQQAASVLGWISLGTGIASAVLGMAPSVAKMAGITGRGAKRLTRAPVLKHSPVKVTRPIAYVENSTVLYSADGIQNDVVMHRNLWGKGIKGFETHGGLDGTLMNGTGGYDEAAHIAMKEIAPRLVGTPKDEPIVLLACYGGRSGAAQRMANVLQRPVYGYDQPIYVYRAQQMQALQVTSHLNNIPTQDISLWRRLWGAKGIMGNSRRELATGRMYHPH